MLINLLPLVTGLLPVVAVHGAYQLAIQAHRVPACLPYLEGCTSISAAGRYPPASYLFKAAMLPESVLLAMFWLVSAAWLGALQANAGVPRRPAPAVTTMGMISAICLVLYVTFLGTDEPFYEFMRRFGIYLYFAGTVVAQWLLATRVRALAILTGDQYLKRLTTWQLYIAGGPFILGIANLALKALLDNADRAENVIEWQVALLMQAYFVIAWKAWRHTRLKLWSAVERN